MSLKVCSIASGSKGNCIYVASGNTELVIDLGISYARAERSIKTLGGSGIENILLTHCHTDHFSHVPSALDRGATLYYNAICRAGVAGLYGKTVETRGRFDVGDISVMPFSVSHDVPCVGYKLRCGDSKISVVTDLGCITEECIDFIKDSGTILLESNYDEGMLYANPRYPYFLKNRINGIRGHLSNAASSAAVCKLAQSGVSRIILAHISGQNNTPDIALNSCRSALDRIGMLGHILLSVAGQDKPGELCEVI